MLCVCALCTVGNIANLSHFGVGISSAFRIRRQEAERNVTLCSRPATSMIDVTPSAYVHIHRARSALGGIFYFLGGDMNSVCVCLLCCVRLAIVGNGQDARLDAYHA